MRRGVGVALIAVAFLTAPAGATVAEPGSLRGTVVNTETKTPIEGICVRARRVQEPDGTPARTRQRYETTTDEDGAYRIGGMKPGHYVVVFLTCPDAKGDAPPFAPVTFRAQDGIAPPPPVGAVLDPDARYAELVRILPGIPTTGIDAGLSAGASVTGVVLDPSGEPLADVCVHARYDATKAASAVVRTNRAGRYDIRGLLPLDETTATEGFDMLLEFTDCSRVPRYATSQYAEPVHFRGPRARVTADSHTMQKDRSSCIPPGRGVRSTEGITETVIEFVNTSSVTASVYWLGYDGQRVLYATLPPGQTLSQPTFLTHPWVVVDEDGRCLGYAISTKATQTLRLR